MRILTSEQSKRPGRSRKAASALGTCCTSLGSLKFIQASRQLKHEQFIRHRELHALASPRFFTGRSDGAKSANCQPRYQQKAQPKGSKPVDEAYGRFLNEGDAQAQSQKVGAKTGVQEARFIPWRNLQSRERSTSSNRCELHNRGQSWRPKPKLFPSSSHFSLWRSRRRSGGQHRYLVKEVERAMTRGEV